MGRRRWRFWRNVCICVCSPCITLALLFVYAGLVVCLRMNTGSSSHWTETQSSESETYRFVAQGALRNKSFGPVPQSFWQLHPYGDAFWNRLQSSIDLYFSPIQHFNKKKKQFPEAVLTQSFTKVTDVENMIGKLPQQIQNFVSQMHKRDYTTLIQPDGICGAGAKDEKEPPLLLLAIKTTELNFRNRQAVRQTWGKEGWAEGHNGSSSGGYIRRVFLLGRDHEINHSVISSELLQLESKHYGDILQWDFKDTFFNLTLKDVLFWSWFSRFCGKTRFVFKGDDDVFVNTPRMITYLRDQLKTPQVRKTMNSFMVGDVIGAAFPSRVNDCKYFIPENFYKGLYPAYAGGGGVVYSGLLAKRLHGMSKRVHLFPIDDVYVGMCMVRLNAFPVHHPAFLTFDFSEKEAKESCSYHTILLVHKRSPSQLVQLWRDMRNTQAQCWNVTLRDAAEDTRPVRPTPHI